MPSTKHQFSSTNQRALNHRFSILLVHRSTIHERHVTSAIVQSNAPISLTSLSTATNKILTGRSRIFFICLFLAPSLNTPQNWSVYVYFLLIFISTWRFLYSILRCTLLTLGSTLLWCSKYDDVLSCNWFSLSDRLMLLSSVRRSGFCVTVHRHLAAMVYQQRASKDIFIPTDAVLLSLYAINACQ